ncbi:MFS transporter [Paeniroseomonas aquatica]|uniref:MFS transporter n=1 Tax=Paeniroseomonas aquatica TaxID=373043 RepID=UPI0036069A70
MPEPAAPATDSLFSHAEVRTIVMGLMLALFLSSLDQTIVATALSSIAGDLGGFELMPWVVSAYLISSTVTTPIYGRLSDLYGRRPVLLVSVTIFVAGAVLSALAPTMLALIAARVVQGLGGGGLRAISSPWSATSCRRGSAAGCRATCRPPSPPRTSSGRCWAGSSSSISPGTGSSG